jgi:hypothetical protein
MKKDDNNIMLPKFIKILVIEGFSTVIERMLNVNHIIQFEPNRGRAGHCHLYLSDGKVICVVGQFEELIEKIKQ